MKAYHLNYAAVGKLSPHTAKEMADAAMALTDPAFYPTVYPKVGKLREHAKNEIAHLLGNIDPACLAFSASTSEAFASLIQALPLNAGLGIAVGRSMFISLRAALSALQERGIQVHAIGDHRGCVRPRDIDQLPCDRVGLVVVEWVNWLSGYRNDIQSLAVQCRETNIPLVVDAVQGLGAADINYNLDQVGAIVCGGHKWLCGPEGTGFSYISPWLIEKLDPPCLGYRSLTNSVDDLDGPIARRQDAAVLEVGTQNTLGLLGLAAALRRLRNNAYSQRTARIREAVSGIIEDLKYLPEIEFLTPLDPSLNAGIITFKVPGIDANQLVRHFAVYGLHCGSRHGWVRISPGPEARSQTFRRLFKSAVKATKNQIEI